MWNRLQQNLRGFKLHKLNLTGRNVYDQCLLVAALLDPNLPGKVENVDLAETNNVYNPIKSSTIAWPWRASFIFIVSVNDKPDLEKTEALLKMESINRIIRALTNESKKQLIKDEKVSKDMDLF
jgi:hypothetical protein